MFSKAFAGRVEEADVKFIPRNGQTSWDFSNFILFNQGWESTDISSIIPADGKKILLCIRLSTDIDNTQGSGGSVRLASSSNEADNNINQIVQTIDGAFPFVGLLESFGFLDVGTDRAFFAEGGATGNIVMHPNVQICGWFEYT